ncbi:MAG: hypothetical protein L0G99_04755 [Propionibacteriales bacterium]|nr:hypothetical protein [Propionibacteriales bacterium]
MEPALTGNPAGSEARLVPRGTVEHRTFFRWVIDEITAPSVVLASIVTFTICAVLPLGFVSLTANDYLIPFPTEWFSLAMRNNPMVLLFALLAAIPYVLPFGAQVKNGYFGYARMRGLPKRLLASRYLAAAIVSGVTFFITGMVIFAASRLTPTRFQPEVYGLTTPEQIFEAERTYVTFSQLLVAGPWAYGTVYSLWLGLNAAVYSCLALSCCLLVRNRLLGLALPWVATFVAAFAMAVMGLAAISPDTIFPFNLEQLPLWYPLVPFVAAVVVSGLAATVVLKRVDTLDKLQ